jgi:hypothetical protein
MATITLTADTDYSALSLSNGDDIDCAGFILTLDIQPTETEIDVVSPGTNGRVVFSGAWVIPTWDFYAGSSTAVGMIGTLPSGAEIRSITGGGINNARGININNGIVGTSTGGSGSSSHGIHTNNGSVETSTGGGASANGVTINNGYIDSTVGGSGTNSQGVNTNQSTGTVGTATPGTGGNAQGVNINNGHIETAIGSTSTTFVPVVNTNNGTIGSVTAGSVNGATGVGTNNGHIDSVLGGSVSGANGVSTCGINSTIGTVTGGSASGAHGVNTNNGTIGTATGGTVNGANGVVTHRGLILHVIGGSTSTAYGVSQVETGRQCLRITDTAARAVNNFQGGSYLFEGPHVNGVVDNNVKTIYSIGPLSENATIAGDAVVVTIPVSGGSANRAGIRVPSFAIGPGA